MRGFFCFPIFIASCLAAMQPQIKITYYKPALPTSKEIFKLATAEYQVEGLYNVYGGVNIFGSGSYITVNTTEEVRFFPLTIGVKYVQPLFRTVSAYGYTGPRLYYVQRVGENAFRRSRYGGAVGGGIMTKVSKHWVFDTFGEWALPVMVDDVELGRWSVGTGFGVIF